MTECVSRAGIRSEFNEWRGRVRLVPLSVEPSEREERGSSSTYAMNLAQSRVDLSVYFKPEIQRHFLLILTPTSHVLGCYVDIRSKKVASLQEGK